MLSSVRRGERDAVAGADRQLAVARDGGARIGIDVGGAGLGPRGPGADGQRAEIGAARRRHPGRAEADGRGDDQRQQGDEDQPHGQFLRGGGRSRSASPPQSFPGKASALDDTGLAGFGGSLADGLVGGLGRVVEHLLDLHQDVGAALGQHRRRSGLESDDLRRAVGRDVRGCGGCGSFAPMPTPGSSLTSTP